MQINSAAGKIDIHEIGETLFHEHIICTSPEFQRVFSEWLPRKQVVDIAVSKIKYAAEKFGVKTIFDVTPLTLGRDIGLLKEVSEKSGVNIIPSTGFYCYESFSLRKLSVPALTKFLLTDIENTGASLLKCAVDAAGLTPLAAKTLEVMSCVHKETNIPIYVHTHAASKTGIPALELLTGLGVPAHKIVFGHVSDANDITYPLELLKHNTFVSVDRIHQHNAQFILQLINANYSDRIMVSHDHICCLDTIMENPQANQKEPYGLDVVHGKILPELRASGVDEKTVKQLTDANIIRLFEK